MAIESDKGKEIPRSIRVGLIGAIASGKSTLSKILVDSGEFSGVSEAYRENPFLGGFYSNPSRYSFLSQQFYLDSAVDNSSRINILSDAPLVLDPDIEMNRIFAETQHQMGWMTNIQMLKYNNRYRQYESEGKIIRPDIYIVLEAPVEILLQRIGERVAKDSREYEKCFVDDPAWQKYLAQLCENINEWLNKKWIEDKFPPIARIKTASGNIAGYGYEEVKNYLGYYQARGVFTNK